MHHQKPPTEPTQTDQATQAATTANPSVLSTRQDEPLVLADKRYFSIGEVSDVCGVKSHVLRYWEQEFPQLKPIKRRGNRRYYTAQDVFLVRHIKDLLYSQGFTIEGARTQLKQESKTKSTSNTRSREVIQTTIKGLEKVLQELAV